MDTRDLPRTLELMPRAPATLGTRAPAPSASPPPLNVRVLLRSVLRHRWWILLFWLLGTVLGLAFIQAYFEPKYEAVSLLQVEPVAFDPFNPRGGGRDQAFLETQRQLITSTNTLLAASEDPRIARSPLFREVADPVSTLRKELKAQIVPNSNLIQVTMSSQISEEAAAVVNAVVDAYLKADLERTENVNRQQVNRLTDFAQQLKGQVEDRRRAWLELADRGNIDPSVPSRSSEVVGPEAGTVPSRLSVTIEEYGRIRGELVTTSINLAEAEALLEDLNHLRSQQRDVTDSTAMDSSVALEQQFDWQLRHDKDLLALRGQYEELEQRAASASRISRAPANEPTVKLVKARQREIVEQYHELYQEKLAQLQFLAEQQLLQPGSHSRGAGPSGLLVDRPLEEAEARARTLRSRRQQLETMLTQLDVINRKQGSDAVQVSFIQADLEQTRGMLAAVERRIESLRFESQGRSQIIRIDEARPSKLSISDKRPKLMAVAPFLVLFSVLGAFTTLEVRSRRVDRPEDLSQWAQTEVFAIPQLPQLQLTDGRGLLSRRRRSADEVIEEYAHRIDHLRVALCGGALEAGRGRCVMVTSAVAGEGKTTLTAQLGARCADSGLRTVLVDADLRTASLGQVFDLVEAPGLSEVLTGQLELEAALIDLPQIGGCKLLAAGAPLENPGRPLQGPRLRETIEQLRQSFDIVIIDTPPILPVPDGLVLGRWTDGVILAARHDESRLPLLSRARHLLQNAGLPIFGIALNGVQPSPGSTYAYSYAQRFRRPPSNDAV